MCWHQTVPHDWLLGSAGLTPDPSEQPIAEAYRPPRSLPICAFPNHCCSARGVDRCSGADAAFSLSCMMLACLSLTDMFLDLTQTLLKAGFHIATSDLWPLCRRSEPEWSKSWFLSCACGAPACVMTLDASMSLLCLHKLVACQGAKEPPRQQSNLPPADTNTLTGSSEGRAHATWISLTLALHAENAWLYSHSQTARL